MAANSIRLIYEKKWVNYTDSSKISHVGGIYVIGVKKQRQRDIEYLYLGQSQDINERILDHKYGDQMIDGFVKESFRRNGGINLRVKWIRDPRHKRNERTYKRCVEKILGYKLEYNVYNGNN